MVLKPKEKNNRDEVPRERTSENKMQRRGKIDTLGKEAEAACRGREEVTAGESLALENPGTGESLALERILFKALTLPHFPPGISGGGEEAFQFNKLDCYSKGFVIVTYFIQVRIIFLSIYHSC